MPHPRNQAIAAEFLRIAEELESQQANPYRIRAYRRAARIIGRLSEDAGSLALTGELLAIKGIGADLARKVALFCERGPHADLSERDALPPAIAAWADLPGLTPAVVRYLYERLHIRSLDDLEALVRSRFLRTLRGITAPDEAILEGIARRRAGR